MAHLVVFQVRGRMLARLLVADCLWDSRPMSNGPERPRRWNVDDDNWWLVEGSRGSHNMDSVNEDFINLRVFKKIVKYKEKYLSILSKNTFL